MELQNAMSIAASGMRTQSVRMRVIAENIANADTTAQTPGGDPYRRKTVSFANVLDRESGVKKLAVARVGQDMSPFRTKYDPGHPAADAKGYVKLPNTTGLIENMDMKQAQRSYEANLGVIEINRSMYQRTLELLRTR
jgi:flagellar basal-body rod protein FlgC